MMIGVDGVSPPTDGEATVLADLGVRVMGGYIACKPAALWTPAAWTTVWEAGLLPVPIFSPDPGDTGGDHETGSLDGNRVLLAMQGLHLSGAVVLDIESPKALANDYVYGWIDAIEAGDGIPIVYGVPVELAMLADRSPWHWVASWQPSGLLTSLPDIAAWQYTWGSRWDYSVWDSEAPTAEFNGNPSGSL